MHGLVGSQPVVLNQKMVAQCVVAESAPCPRRACNQARLFLSLSVSGCQALAAAIVAPAFGRGNSQTAFEAYPDIQRSTALARPLYGLTQFLPNQTFQSLDFVH